jgi:uncharacterized membrane protein YcaP (DUF421 family)
MGTILRATAAYWLLLFTLRVVGRRALNQMTPFELILIFLLGGMSIQAVVSDDRSLTNAFIAIMTVAMNHVLVAWLKQRSEGFRKIADGTPIVIVQDGRWDRTKMALMRLQEQDVMSVARGQGMRRIEEVQEAIVERNGSISVYKVENQDKDQKKEQGKGKVDGREGLPPRSGDPRYEQKENAGWVQTGEAR